MKRPRQTGPKLPKPGVETQWTVNEEGQAELPLLSSFAIAVVEESILAVQLVGHPNANAGFPDGKVQFALNVADAKLFVSAMERSLRTVEGKLPDEEPDQD
jgi:hypothetical protein